jgi:dTDP-4-dehydrorhamnose 3,5-epimerase
MGMKFQPTNINGVWIVKSDVNLDKRGSFLEWMRIDQAKTEINLDFKVEQTSISKSKKNVIRGMHYSINPVGQAKWVTCVLGSIKDVVIDLRSDSQTYLQQFQIELDGLDGKSIMISSGIAHGFLCQSESAIVSYALSSAYRPDLEKNIQPFDSNLNINWGISESQAILSDKDRNAPAMIIYGITK